VTLPLLLASASPRRRELLERIGVPLEVRPADVDETPLASEDPRAYVARIAALKATAVTRAPGQWVLAADTTVTIDGLILGKAETPDEARAMLSRLAGRDHEVVTAFVLRGDDAEHAEVVAAAVRFVAADADLIDDYVASGEWRGKAGAYALQGIGAALVSEVRGSVTTVIGLPVAEVVAALRRLGGPAPRFAAGQPS
jgi:septum formation protein